MEPGTVRGGWQHEAASRVERHFRRKSSSNAWDQKTGRLFGCVTDHVDDEDSAAPEQGHWVGEVFTRSAAARVCREAGARVTTNVLVRDLDLLLSEAADNRRLEVVADGLPIFSGSQLVLDTTLVCVSHFDCSPHTGAADTDGVVFQRAT